MKPTPELYESLDEAYSYFNEKLFDSSLPKVIFTVQRQAGVMGYFAPERWGNLEGTKCHEIAINPSYIANSCLIEVLQTLVHEMVHCWQYCYGNPSRSHYHNREWARRMILIGLMPSATGVPGGAKTGSKMSDYILKDGLFVKVFEELKEKNSFQLKWIDRIAAEKVFDPAFYEQEKNDEPQVQFDTVKKPSSDSILNKGDALNIKQEKRYSELAPSDFFIKKPLQNNKVKTKYQCPGCSAKVWGKPYLNIFCGDCDIKFEGV